MTDLVNKMQNRPVVSFQSPWIASWIKGKAYAVPQSVSPWPLVTRLDILEAAKVDPPKTWEELVEVCKKLQKPPKLTGFGLCLGLHADTDNNVMNMIWCYGGKLVEADNKTVALHSKGTVAAVQLIADMFNKHKIIPKGAIAWDNTGNNKAYQSRQVIFVLESHQHLCSSGGLGQRSVQHHRVAPDTGRSCRRDRRTHARPSGCSSSTIPILRSPKDWPNTGWPRRTCG